MFIFIVLILYMYNEKLPRVSLSAAELAERKLGRCSHSSVNTNL